MEVNNTQNNSLPKLAMWLEVMPEEQVSDMPKFHPMLTYDPTHVNFWVPITNIEEPKKTWWSTMAIGAYTGLKFKLHDQPITKELFLASYKDFIQKAKVKPDYLMGYTVWFDGWQFQDFPSVFCGLCKKLGITPIVTWQISFKRTGKGYFLDEFMDQLSDEKSKLYKFAYNYMKDAKAFKEEIDLRLEHEGNMPVAYNWSGYLNGGNDDKVNLVVKMKDGNYKLIKDLTKEEKKVYEEELKVKIAEAKAKGIKVKEGSNLIPDGPERVIAAWLMLKAIRDKAGATNVKLVWCPEADPPDNETWNTYDAYFPGPDNVDMIGFDVYQRDANKNFKYLMRKPLEFINAVNGIRIAQGKKPIPVSICEASTEPEKYRVQFIKDLFETAADNKFVYVGWFNENKVEGDTKKRYRFEELVIDKIADTIRKYSNREEAIKRLKNKNYKPSAPALKETMSDLAYKTFVETVTNMTSSQKLELMKRETIALTNLYMNKLDIHLKTKSYNDAMDQKRREKDEYIKIFGITVGKREKITKTLGKFNLLNALYVLNLNDAANRIRQARQYYERWLISKVPKKFSSDPKDLSDYQVALAILDKNTKLGVSDELKNPYPVKEYILSLVEKKRMMIKYYEMLSTLTKELKKEKGDEGEEASPYDPLTEAEQACKDILTLLGDHNYMCALNNPKSEMSSYAEIEGRKADAYLSRGDIYVMEAHRDLVKAKKYYLKVRELVNRKEKLSGESERYLNYAVKIGLALVQGYGAQNISDIDASVKSLAEILLLKDSQIDPGLKTKAKLYQAEILMHAKDLEYPDVSGLNMKDAKAVKDEHDKLVVEKLTRAYTLYADMYNTEYSFRASRTMQKLKGIIQSRRSGTVYIGD